MSSVPAGAVLELSAPSVPDELAERVVSGEVPASVSAIRAERTTDRSSERPYDIGGTFIDYLALFNGTNVDYAAGIAAHVLRRWKEPNDRSWLAGCLRMAAEMIGENRDERIPLYELPRTTVRKLKEAWS